MGNSISDYFKMADSGIFDDVPYAPSAPVAPKFVPVEHDPFANFPNADAAFLSDNDIIVFLYHCSIAHSIYFIVSAIAVYFLFFGKKRWQFGIGVILITVSVSSLAGGFLDAGNRIYPPHFAAIYSLIPFFIGLVFKALKKQPSPVSLQGASKNIDIKNSKFKERLKRPVFLVVIAGFFYLGIYFLSYGGCKFNATKFSKDFCIEASVAIALGAVFLLCFLSILMLFLKKKEHGADVNLRFKGGIDTTP